MAKFVVKGLTGDRSQRVFVCAGTLLELKEEMKRKLKLPEGDYEVYQAKDGIMIDDDYVFQLLAQEAKETKVQLEVMLLTDSAAWTDGSLLSPQPSNCSTPQESSEQNRDRLDSLGDSFTSSFESLTSTPVARRTLTFAITDVCEFLDEALEKLNSDNPPKNMFAIKKRAVREACHAVGRHMLKKLKDYRRVTAKALARQIIDYDGGRYSKLFQVVGNAVSDPGYKSFTQCIYGYVNLNKGPENKSSRGTRSSSRSEDDDDFGLLPPAPSKQDLYGCVAYEPPLPFGETASSQEEKRLQAIDLENPEDTEADTLMAATYATQRVDINRGKPLKVHLPTVIRSWPLLMRKSHFIRHAQTLLGKDVEAVFTNNVAKHWKAIFDLIHQHCELESKKEVVPQKISSIMSLVTKALSQGIDNRSIEARCIAIFPMIALYLDEKLDKLFSLLPDTATEEEVVAAGSNLNGYPILIIRGISILEFTLCDVVLVGQLKMSASSPLEGFLILILSYFVFTCLYQPANHSSLEFYQRYFMEVNPPDGDKRAVKKRCIDGVDSKVKKLASQLTHHTCHWTLGTH